MDYISRPEKVVEEVVRVASALAETPRVDEVLKYVQRAFDLMRDVADQAQVLNSAQMLTLFASPAKIKCFLQLMRDHGGDINLVVGVFMQYLEVMHTTLRLQDANVAWTRELRQRMERSGEVMKAQFIPALTAVLHMCDGGVGGDGAGQLMADLNKANEAFMTALLQLQHCMSELTLTLSQNVTAVAAPESLRGHVSSAMWSVTRALLAAVLYAMVMFYWQLVVNYDNESNGEPSMLASTALTLITPVSPTWLTSALTYMATQNSAAGHWAHLQSVIASTSDTSLFGSMWFAVLEALFSPVGSIMAFVRKWTLGATYYKLMQEVGGYAARSILSPIGTYLGIPWLVSAAAPPVAIILARVMQFMVDLSVRNFGVLATALALFRVVGRYVYQLINTVPPQPTGWKCNKDLGVCVPDSSSRRWWRQTPQYATREQCAPACKKS